MFREIFRFEIGYHLRRPSTYLFFGILFLISFLFMTSDIMAGGAATRVLRNSPFVIAENMVVLAAIGMLITAALAGTAILRDYDHQTHELLFTTPITRVGLFGGRFAGAFLAMILVYSAIPLGMMVGTLMPWIDPEKLGPFVLMHYLSPTLLLLLPKVFIISAIFFAAGLVLRSHFAIYTLGFLLLAGDVIAEDFRKNLDSEWTTIFTDALGRSTFELVTRYWTPVEKNTLVVHPGGPILFNSIFWAGVAALLVFVAFLLFRFEVTPRSLRRRRPDPAGEGMGDDPVPPPVPSAVQLDFGLGSRWRQTLSLARLNFLGIVRTVPFLAIAAIATINIAIVAWFQADWYDTSLYPVTYYMAEIITTRGGLFFILLVTIYAGELVWRERALKGDQLADTLPVESLRTIVGKLLGLSGALAIVLIVGMLATIAVQLVRGYTHLEVGLYLRWLFLTEYPYLIALTLLTFFVHTVLNHKYLGHLMMILFYIGMATLETQSFEHHLYSFGLWVPFTYSDMNGFGHLVTRLAWYKVYGLALGLVLLAAASLIWIRGTDTGLRLRVRRVRARLTPRLAAFGISALLITLFCGAVIIRSTTVLNRYETKKETEARQADFEVRYRGYRELDQPRIVGMRLRADLVPEERRFIIGGDYVLINPYDHPIDSLYLGIPAVALGPPFTVDSLAWSRGAEVLSTDSTHGVYLFRLAEPLEPGDSLGLAFGVRLDLRGFPNSEPNPDIVANGSFIGDAYLPSIGYDDYGELMDPDARKRLGLPPRDRLPPIDDEIGLRYGATHDSDWLNFEATISTAPDQIAVTPGYLVREWLEGGRRYFQYRSEAPVPKWLAILSARYSVHRDWWTDPVSGEPVAIEIYYHPGHEYNLERMTLSVQRSLDYFTDIFSPFQHRQVRILEFPRYQNFAMSIPNTIPYSEGIGFVTRVREGDDDIDMPFFVTAHEVAHQWWGGQTRGAVVQGHALLTESLAEYSALKVMEREYGRDMTHKLLRYELDRYLRGRAWEQVREQPLMLTEEQPYIHYHKGALALYALQDFIGEDQLNGALGTFLSKHQYPTPPYPTSLDLIAEFRAATPDSLQHVITDLFETITLWDHKAEEATAVERADGRHAVTLTVHARKLRADSLGAETEIALGDWVDIGVFGPPEPGNRLGRPLYLQKHHITEPVTTIEVVVDELPVRAGIDPYNKLIDREPKDNVREVVWR